MGKNKKSKKILPIIIIIVILFSIIVITYISFGRQLLFSFFTGKVALISNVNKGITNGTDNDVVANLISGYSMFISMVIFIIGIPVLFVSYVTWKKNKESLEEIENKISLIEDLIGENEAYKSARDIYEVDPNDIRKPKGIKELNKFSKCFRQRQRNDVRKVFFEAIKLVEEKVVDINSDEIKEFDKAAVNEMLTAINYFTLCEESIPYSSTSRKKQKEEFSLYDIYREKSNACKQMGLHFTSTNGMISLDYLLMALEYCQKAIVNEPDYILTYNNKSNILKDIYRLICISEDGEGIRDLLEEKLKDKIKSFYYNVFDFKEIGKYAEVIFEFNEMKIDEEAREEVEKIIKLKELCDTEKKCKVCEINCTKYFQYLDDFSPETLLLLILLESIICIEKNVFNKSAFEEEKADKDFHLELCRYNYIISNYLLVIYSRDKLKANLESGELKIFTDFDKNMLMILERKKNINDLIEFKNQISNDIDIKSLFENDNNGYLDTIKKTLF